MPFHPGLRCGWIIERLQIGLDDIESARRFAMWAGIHQDCGLVAVLQRVSQIETANAEINHAHRLWQLSATQQASHFNSERVVSKENVADAGHEDGWLGHRWRRNNF